jgi:hypothetical protein
MGHADYTSLVDHGECAFEVVITVTAMMLPLVVANVRHVAFPTRRKKTEQMRGLRANGHEMHTTHRKFIVSSSRVHRGFIADRHCGAMIVHEKPVLQARIAHARSMKRALSIERAEPRGPERVTGSRVKLEVAARVVAPSNPVEGISS